MARSASRREVAHVVAVVAEIADELREVAGLD
jgi:hypothetical protein